MGIKSRISTPVNNSSNLLAEKWYREEREYRCDRLVEKWSKVKEIGKGITEMPTQTARNLAVLLENQTKAMSKMNEAQFAAAFNGYTPENMLRLVRLSYPNSIRGLLFTEFAMESAHDSIKYVEPIYTKTQSDDASATHAKAKLDDDDNFGAVMYETTESRYATEMLEGAIDGLTVTFKTAIPGDYIDGYSVVYGTTTANATEHVVAVQVRNPHVPHDVQWVGGDIESATQEGNVVTFVASTAGAGLAITKAFGRFDSDQDLTGQYLGEVELRMKDYHFMPRIISLGVTWTQLAELVLDTSFGVSAEETLMDYAAQEIKKTLDYQAVKMAAATQALRAAENTVEFDAEALATADTKDSYYHTAQLIGQAIEQISNKQLDSFGRGGVSAIVGGPNAVTYLKLNKNWSDRGKMPAIGGHQVGELDGVPVFKVPGNIIPNDTLITTWKNDQVEGDVAMAIGTLMPFYSTGALQRKNLYKEAAVARFEDTKVLQPKYFGRIQIKNIRGNVAI